MVVQKLKNGLRFGLAELVIVVAGVLIALAADDWRQSRALHEAELASLARLLEDMEVDLRDLADNHQRTLRGLEAATWLMEHRHGPFPTQATLGERLTDFTACSILSPNTSEYTALRSSGQLATLRDAEFRQQLADHYERYPFVAGAYANDCRAMEEGITAVAAFVEFRLDPNLDTWPMTVTGQPSDILTDPLFQKSVAWAAQWRLGLSQREEGLMRDISVLRDRATELANQ